LNFDDGSIFGTINKARNTAEANFKGMIYEGKFKKPEEEQNKED